MKVIVNLCCKLVLILLDLVLLVPILLDLQFEEGFVYKNKE